MFKKSHRMMSFILAALIALIIAPQSGTVFAQDTLDPVSNACAATPGAVGGQGFTFSGQGFTFSGQGFTFSGQGFTFSGQGFTFSGQGFTFSGQSIDPYEAAQEILDNLISPEWFEELLPGITPGVGYGDANSAILVIDDQAHGSDVLAVLDVLVNDPEIAAYMGGIEIHFLDIGTPEINYDSDAMAVAIDEKVTELQDAGIEHIVLNMSFGFLPCEDEDSGFNFYEYIEWQTTQQEEEEQSNQPPADSVVPIFECWYPDYETESYVARFAYDNNNLSSVYIPPGADNNFSPGTQNGLLPVLFEAGQQSDVFEVPFNGDDLEWSLTGPDNVSTSAFASTEGPICPDQIDSDEDGWIDTQDCAPFDSAINPDAVEIPNNEIDENCDGVDLQIGSGDIQFTLIWDNDTDYDLHVIDPFNEEIYFGNPTSDSGGELDIDAYPGCEDNVEILPPVENVFWADGDAPGGTYLVYVHLFTTCEDGPGEWELTVRIDNEIVLQETGTGTSGLFAIELLVDECDDEECGYDECDDEECGYDEEEEEYVPTADVIPVLECVAFDLDTEVYTARLAYINGNSRSTFIPPTADNYFSGDVADRMQPNYFLPGDRTDVFEVDFNGEDLTWTIVSPNGNVHSVTADDETNGCVDEGYDVGTYFEEELGYTPEQTQTLIIELFQNVEDDSDLSAMIELLAGYAADSGANPFQTVYAVASSGNFFPWLGSTPLAPARWDSTIAASASLGNAGSLWQFSQHGNVRAAGAGYEVENMRVISGTSFSAPGISLALAQWGKYPAACTSDGIHPPLVNFELINAPLTGNDLNPFTCAYNSASPIVEAIDDQDDLNGTTVSPLQVVASDDNDEDLDFTDNGTLPPGLSIDNSGLITGILTAPISEDTVYPVIIYVRDDDGNVTPVEFNWTVRVPDVTPDMTPQVTPEVTPQQTPEVTPSQTEDPHQTEEPRDPGIRDADWDGFTDNEDTCPWQGNEGGLGVDEVGCPYYDADWDGYTDREDACPWQGNEGGLGVDEVGCPYYDADWDGYTDREDACPWRGNEYGYGVDATGCPIEENDPEQQVSGMITSPANGSSVQSPVNVTFTLNAVPDGYVPFILVQDPTDQDQDGWAWIHPQVTNGNNWLLPDVLVGIDETTCNMPFGLVLYIAGTLPEPDAVNISNSWMELDSVTVTKICGDTPPEATDVVTDEPEVTVEPFVTEDPDNYRDADWDGFVDSEDECPWQGDEGGLGVDEVGCPYYDADWDGIYDREDECPWQGDEGGLGVDEVGCPYYDADWDGIYDRDEAD